MTLYGVTTDYDYSADHKREKIDVWSGAWFSVWEATGLSLPNNTGYMLTTYNGDKIRVSCGSPQTDANYRDIDAAINTALNAHHANRGDWKMTA